MNRLLDLAWRRAPTSFTVSLGLLAVRLAAGSAFLLHGWSKIQDPLHWMGSGSQMLPALQALAAISEFGGGLAWILGLLVPLASFGIVCTMGVAIATHLQQGAAFVGKGHTYELPLVYLSTGLLLLLAGPGRLSLDAWLLELAKHPAAPRDPGVKS
jgi:putative oxidoreductase